MFCRVCLYVLPWLLLLGAMDVAWAAGEAPDPERTLSWDISAELQPDASLLLTETIRVFAAGHKIKRGIFLTFTRKQAYGQRKLHHFGFDVLSVTCDGADVPYQESDSGVMTVLRIGNPDTMLAPGEHTYVIRYRTTGHVRQFDGADGLHFLAVSPEWQLYPVERASFALTLPAGVAALADEAFTGSEEALGADAARIGPLAFATTRPLMPGEGFSVRVRWPAGAVQTPFSLAEWMGERRELCLSLVGGLCLLLNLCLWWFRLRRVSLLAIPLFSPPPGLMPGLVSATREGGYGKRAFAAELVWLASRGFVRLCWNDAEKLGLERQPQPRTRAPWEREAGADLCRLLLGKEGAGAKAQGKTDGGGVLSRGYVRMRTSIASALEEFDSISAAWIWAPVFLLLGVVLLCWVLDNVWWGDIYDDDPIQTFMIFAGGACLAGVLAAQWAWVSPRWYRDDGPGYQYGMAIFMGCVALLCFGFVALWLDGDELLCGVLAAVVVPPVVLLCSCGTVRNQEGLELDSQIRGLEMYIRVAEKDRLAAIHAPEDTVDKYEEMLPYAMALNCAEAWQQRFAPVLRAVDYQPDWVRMPARAVGLTGPDPQAPWERALSRVADVSAATATTVAVQDANRRRQEAERAAARGGSGSSGWSSSGGGSSGGRGGGGW